MKSEIIIEKCEILEKSIISLAKIYDLKDTTARQKALLETMVGAAIWYLSSPDELYAGKISVKAVEAVKSGIPINKLTKEHKFPRKQAGKLLLTENHKEFLSNKSRLFDLFISELGRFNLVLKNENRDLIKYQKDATYVDEHSSYNSAGINLVEMSIEEINKLLPIDFKKRSNKKNKKNESLEMTETGLMISETEHEKADSLSPPAKISELNKDIPVHIEQPKKSNTKNKKQESLEMVETGLMISELELGKADEVSQQPKIIKLAKDISILKERPIKSGTKNKKHERLDISKSMTGSLENKASKIARKLQSADISKTRKENGTKIIQELLNRDDGKGDKLKGVSLNNLSLIIIGKPDTTSCYKAFMDYCIDNHGSEIGNSQLLQKRFKNNPEDPGFGQAIHYKRIIGKAGYYYSTYQDSADKKNIILKIANDLDLHVEFFYH